MQTGNGTGFIRHVRAQAAQEDHVLDAGVSDRSLQCLADPVLVRSKFLHGKIGRDHGVDGVHPGKSFRQEFLVIDRSDAGLGALFDQGGQPLGASADDSNGVLFLQQFVVLS